jgi:hypothetical protein
MGSAKDALYGGWRTNSHHPHRVGREPTQTMIQEALTHLDPLLTVVTDRFEATKIANFPIG